MTDPHRSQFLAAGILYALLIVYSSLLLGPAGIHYVSMPLDRAWRHFVAMPYLLNDSGQRADWTANLLMLIPLGYALSGACLAESDRMRGWIASAGAIIIAACFILSVKFAQLFFPPRTVSLNYVIAQCLGAGAGIGIFWVFHTRWRPHIVWMARRGDHLAVLLGVYTILIFLYFLAPFDFVLSLDDVVRRLVDLPRHLVSAPGAERGPGLRILIIAGDTLSLVPVGMFLAVTGRGSSPRALILRGLGLMTLVTVLTLFVMGGSPHLVALIYRTVGIAGGVWLIKTIKGKDMRARHYRVARFAPALAVVYCACVVFASGLISGDWRTPDQAMAALEPRGLLPFWHFYIVTKAHAVSSLVVHLLMFAPIGVLVWLRRGFWAKGTVASAALAFLFSLAMEVGRWMKPGLQPDFSDPVIAAVGAALAFRLMQPVFAMLELEAMTGAWSASAPPPSWPPAVGLSR